MKQSKATEENNHQKDDVHMAKKSLANLLAIQKSIFEQISKSPEQAYDFFLDEWMRMTYEEKRTAAAQILRYCIKKVNMDDDHHSLLQPGFELQQL